MSAHSDALKLLAQRELAAAEVRSRLLRRGHSPDETDAAIARLVESGALDDRRVARAHARTASAVKSRGRLRVARELRAMGIPRDIVADAIAEVFGDLDERSLIEQAIQKKLRGRRRPTTRLERARLYQFLIRQGFTASAVVETLRGSGPDESE